MFNTEQLQEKWRPVLDHPDLPEIKDQYKRAVTTVILENQERSMSEDRAFLQSHLWLPYRKLILTNEQAQLL